MNMEIRYSTSDKDYKNYDTKRLREEFHISNLFKKDEVKFVYSHYDRIIVGSITPSEKELHLEGGKELGSDFFLQRREMGVINIGGDGSIVIDGKEYEMQSRDGIYISMGTKEVIFKSKDKSNPAKFYINSAPAHQSYPTTKIGLKDSRQVKAGEVLNKRTIHQYIHPAVCKSCQLTMGMTILEDGAVWNTMPCHTHDRRMEVYLYFDIPQNQAVFHMFGKPNETRHLVMRNEEATISPSWSIHTGVGTQKYTFIWGMVGENQVFDDMDHVKMEDLL